MTRLLRRVLILAATLTALLAAVAVWLAVVMIRTPRYCGWCKEEHP